jgi:hypothetical protein
MVEATNDLTGDNAGKVNIRKIYIMGKKDKKIYIYTINFEDNHIDNIILDEKDKIILELNPQGWH